MGAPAVTVEVAAALLLLALLGAGIGTVLQVRAIAREVRSEGRETRAHLSTSLERVDTLEHALLQAFRESIEGRERAAVETIKEAEALPKPHRPIWRYGSSEKTNGEAITFYVCSVPGCRDVLRVGPDDPVPDGEAG